METNRGSIAMGIALVLSGCAALNADKEPLTITPKSEVATSPVVREILPRPAEPPARSPAASPPSVAKAKTAAAAPALASVAPALSTPAVAPPSVPPGTLYVCSTTVNGKLQQSAIEFAPRVRQLCGRHPEMGVCQYEREACRASGGRVRTTAGVEITMQTEAEYKRKVLRVRFRAD